MEADLTEEAEPVLTIQQRRLLGLVRNNPGVHYSALGRRMGITRQAVEYHAHYLIRMGLIIPERRRRRTHLFSADIVDPLARSALSLFRLENVRALVEKLEQAPSRSWRGLSRELGMTPAGLRWQIRRLEEEGMVRVHRSPGGNVHFVEILRPWLLGPIEPEFGEASP